MRWAHVGGPSHGLWLAGDPGGMVCHQLDFVLRNDAEGRGSMRAASSEIISKDLPSKEATFSMYQTTKPKFDQLLKHPSNTRPIPPFFARVIFLFFSMFTEPGVVPKNPPLKPGPQ